MILSCTRLVPWLKESHVRKHCRTRHSINLSTYMNVDARWLGFGLYFLCHIIFTFNEILNQFKVMHQSIPSDNISPPPPPPGFCTLLLPRGWDFYLMTFTEGRVFAYQYNYFSYGEKVYFHSSGIWITLPCAS